MVEGDQKEAGTGLHLVQCEFSDRGQRPMIVVGNQPRIENS
jgi:hypothetical protein